MELTFDKSIELLEITDISKIKIEDIPLLEKKSKKRWHPDKVLHLKDPAISEEYTINFQQIEAACQMITAYLNGTYQAGNAFNSTNKKQTVHQEPEEVIRQNAPEMQTELNINWETIKNNKYKWTQEEVELSDGFVLKDLLREDFKEDLAMLSIVSFFYGLIVIGILSALVGAMSPTLGTLVGIFWFLQAVSCAFGLLPLSRFWLPEPLQNTMIWFINFGLGIYNWASDLSIGAAWWVQLLVAIPNLFAGAIKYIVLFPLYEIAKAIVADKVVGIVKQNVNYYAGAADWYVEKLVNLNPNEMSSEELFNLSYIFSELHDVKSKT